MAEMLQLLLQLLLEDTMKKLRSCGGRSCGGEKERRQRAEGSTKEDEWREVNGTVSRTTHRLLTGRLAEADQASRGIPHNF